MSKVYANGKSALEYNKEYEAKHYVQFNLKIRKDEKKILKKLESVPSKNGYIVGLIRKDVENG